MQMSKKPFSTLTVAGIALLSSLATASACPFNKGTYTLIADESFSLMMLPPDENSAVELSRIKLMHSDDTVFQGYLTASQGYSTVYLVTDFKDLADSNIAVSFLDRHLKMSSTDTEYVVTQGLPATLYYLARDLWSKHPLNGEIWQRASCGH